MNVPGEASPSTSRRSGAQRPRKILPDALAIGGHVEEAASILRRLSQFIGDVRRESLCYCGCLREVFGDWTTDDAALVTLPSAVMCRAVAAARRAE